MDIIKDYNDAVVTRLNDHEYMASDVAAVVYAENILEDVSDDGQTAEDHLKEMNQQLNSYGVIGVLSVPEFTRSGGRAARFTVGSMLTWYVNPVKNMATAGCQKPIGQLAVYSVGAIEGFIPQIYNDDATPALANPFEALKVQKVEYLGEDDGLVILQIQIESSFALQTINVDI